MQAIASILQSGARSAFFPRTPTTAEGEGEEEEEEEGLAGRLREEEQTQEEGLKSFGGEDGEEGGYGEAD